jgi:plastocyanin
LRRLVVLAAAGAAAAVWANGALAAGWTVWAGPTGYLKKPPPGVPQTTSPAFFLPAALQIHAGDSVTIQTREGHTVTSLGPRTAASVLSHFIVKDPKGGTYDPVSDFLGNPFWWAGKPKFVYNAAAFFAPAGSLTLGDGAFHNRVIAGPGPGNPPGAKPSVTYTFPKAGTYKLVCLFHYPVMNLTVTVKPQPAPIPSQAQVLAAMAKQITDAVATAKSLLKTTAPPKTVVAGVAGGSIDLLQFFPAKLHVPVGTTVRFVNRSRVETHNEVFGNPKSPWLKKYFAHSDQFPAGQVGPELVYGSDPGKVTFDGTNHGNGFLVTKATDTAPFSFPPAATTVTFTKAGTYHYFCEIHGPTMSGTIVVG